MLELDMVATCYETGLAKRLLLEIQSGSWGFSDIFKLLGWKTYLSPDKIDDAYFVGTSVKDGTAIDFFTEKCKALGIHLLPVTYHTQIEQALLDAGIVRAKADEANHILWRYSFWLERMMLKVVSDGRKSQRAQKGPGAVYEYQELIKNGVVLTGDVRERVSALYETHFEHQWLAKAVAAEMNGTEWDSHVQASDSLQWTAALNQCQYPLVQAALYYQHKARLGILKGAVDYAIRDKAGTLPQEKVIKFLGLEMPVHPLTPNFQKTVKLVRGIDYFERIPVLWQTFFWKWGGFLLTDKEE
ncbi:MAG: hypothetical protein EXR54_05605 [Dehalococcoidia bacterium]|nr:hypothetical protein [Dehalococcoidia bacterium]